jgi:human immunodeficiency virus type I enhancer-binding protein
MVHNERHNQQQQTTTKTVLSCSPYSFKTKGNLTKHMKSKAHYKKCMELGINPVMPMDEDSIDMDNDMQSMSSERNSTIPGDEDTDTDDESDGDGDESEGSGE